MATASVPTSVPVRAVLDDHRLADNLSQLVGGDPADEIEATARRLRYDDLQRPVGKRLGACRRTQQNGSKAKQSAFGPELMYSSLDALFWSFSRLAPRALRGRGGYFPCALGCSLRM